MGKGSTLALCAVALLAACHGDSSSAPAADAVQHFRPKKTKSGPSADDLTRGMVEATTTGKSTVPVTVKFDLPTRPVVGQPLDVVVAIVPQIAADSAVLTASGSGGLKLTSDAAPTEMPSVKASQVYRQDVTVIPLADGVQVLGLSVALTHDEITETRVFAVPLIVSSNAAAAPPAAAPAPTTAGPAKH